MRVLQLHTRYRISAGEDSVVDNEAEALRRAGHDVDQLIVENPTRPIDAVRALVRSPHNRAMAERVRAAIAERRPDVVHIHNTWFAMSWSAAVAAADCDVPVVATLHNYRLGCIGVDLFRDGRACTACVGRSPWPGVVHGCYRESRLQSAAIATEVALTRRRGVLDRCIDRFVAPSAFMADRLVEIGVREDRLVVKPHFVVDPGPRPAAPSTSDEIVFVGRLAPGKGVETLTTAWAQRTVESCRLSLVGDGPLAKELNLPVGASALGWQSRSDVTDRLLGARALVMPSEWYEPFGMVLIEAMSCGLPVIATSAAGARDIIGTAALVVPPHRPDRLADAIDELDDATVDATGAANRARFESTFSEAVGVENLVALYQSVGATP